MKKYLLVLVLSSLLQPAMARDVAAHIVAGSCPLPKWPKPSPGAIETGSITVGFLVGDDGQLRETSILSSSGFERLDRASAQAVQGCQFNAATEDGKPITAWGRISYRFTLDNSKSKEAVLAAVERRARLGQAKDQLMLGQLYQSGELGKDKVGNGVVWIRQAAEQGLADAQLAMATTLNPSGRWNNAPDESVEWLRKAADQGQSSAQFLLSRVLAYQGKPDQAQALFEQLLAKQYPHAMYVEAKRLLDSGNADDLPRAIAMLQEAAAKGDKNAHWLLAECYTTGRGVPQNDELAVTHLQQAAKAPIAAAQHALALAYETGKGVKQDAALARLWRETANGTSRRFGGAGKVGW